MDLYLHVGLHKTGTTTFQKEIFPYGSGYTYLGREYSPNLIKKIPFSSRLVISDETLIGRLYKSYENKNNLSWLNDNLNNLDRISALYPNAHIILGVRKHASWILSIYKHYIKYGGTKSKKEFIKSLENKNQRISYSDLMFMDRIKHIIDKFNNRPFVYRTDDIYKNKNILLKNLSFYITGVTDSFDSLEDKQFDKLNKGVDSRQARLIRYLNSTKLYKFSDDLNNKDKRNVLCRKFNLSSFKTVNLLINSSNKYKLSLEEKELSKIEEIFKKDWDLVTDYINNYYI